MNSFMVRRLIVKDWYLQRQMITLAVVAGLIALALLLIRDMIAFLTGTIIITMIVVGVGAQLAMTTILNERKEQTLAFIMSLPISYREYTTAKIMGNLILFLVPWSALVISGFALILFTPAMPKGIIPFVAIMATEMLVSTCFIVSVALMSESLGWTTGAIMIGGLGVSAFAYYVAHIKNIAAGLPGNHAHWTSAASVVLVCEIGTIALLLGVTFAVQSRKKSFL